MTKNIKNTYDYSEGINRSIIKDTTQAKTYIEERKKEALIV